MSAAKATVFVRRMVEEETRGNGDVDAALRRLERHFGLDYWPLWYLRKGKAKTITVELYAKIRDAYLQYCSTKISGLQHEIRTERELQPDDADLELLEAEAQALACKIAKAKTERLIRRGRG